MKLGTQFIQTPKVLRSAHEFGKEFVKKALGV
jgi:hypothetical protein